jgi:pimeloyl-ACP methyl ester carboxylesterase
VTDVVLLHAFPVNRHLWDDQVTFLTGAGYRVVAPDYAGFGESSPPRDATMQALAGQVLESFRGPSTVVGLSMGGYVLMEILRTAPEMVSSAVFVDTKATADTPEARDTRVQMAEQVVSSGTTQPLADALPANLLGATTLSERPGVVAAVRQWIRHAPVEAVAAAQRAMAGRPDSLPTLRTFEGPAVVVWGDEDTISPRAEQNLMLRAMPQAVSRELSGCGHLSAVEAPNQVNEVLLEALRDFDS